MCENYAQNCRKFNLEQRASHMFSRKFSPYSIPKQLNISQNITVFIVVVVVVVVIIVIIVMFYTRTRKIVASRVFCTGLVWLLSHSNLCCRCTQPQVLLRKVQYPPNSEWQGFSSGTYICLHLSSQPENNLVYRNKIVVKIGIAQV